MTQFKGTKGKWKLLRFSEGQMSVRNMENTRKICVSRVNNYDESLANLLLISKAPEMLEMLEKLIKEFDAEHATQYGCELMYLAKQLIKEATEI